MDIFFKFFRLLIRYGLVVTLMSTACLPSAVWAHVVKQQGMCCCPACPAPHPWFVTGELGYANYLDIYQRDAETPLGRFSIGRDLGKLTGLNILNFSLELGIQNGNVMRLPFDPAQAEEFGVSAPVVAKPVLDLLFAIKTASVSDSFPLFALFKIGPAYRRLNFLDRDSINDEVKVSVEAQAGLGYWINKRTNVHLSYQRIFGSNPNFQVNVDEVTGHISKLPQQYAVILGISYSL